MRVSIRAFGPFANRALELAPGITVIVGGNEAGKSSWHAAIYAAVCGLRRGPGRRTEDREFVRRHRPWDGDAWGVESLIELADGRMIEITQDLDGRVDCRAVDVGLGRRDVSDEIMFDGSPDASLWVGLDRRTFLATACVGQADVLAVVESAGALQEHLQRAAATAGADETAARALALLDEYQKEHVGADRSNSVRPLRRAIQAVSSSEAMLRIVQTAHDAYLAQLEVAERLDKDAAAARRRLDVLSAAEAQQQAAAAATERMRSLLAQLEGDPVDLESVRTAGSQVSQVLAFWKAAPSPAPLVGLTSEELAGALGALPPAPVGDLAPAPAVGSAEIAWRAARSALQTHLTSEPEPATPPRSALSPTELRDLARDLDLVVPGVDPDLVQRRAELTQRLATTPERGVNLPLLIGAIAVVVVGFAGAFLTSPLVALVGVAIGAGLAALAMRHAFGNARSHVFEELREVDAGLGSSQVAAEAAERTIEEAGKKALAAGLAADSAVLLELAAEVDSSRGVEEKRRVWETARTEFEQTVTGSEASLRAALIDRGIVEAGDLEAAVTGYREACAERGRVAAQAARRPDLERELSGRSAAEAAFAEAAGRHREAVDALLDASREHGFAGTEVDAALVVLERWQSANHERVQLAERQVQLQSELNALLGGRSEEEVEMEAESARRRAEAARAGLPSDEVEVEAASPDLASHLREAHASVERTAVAAASARGSLKQTGSTPAQVAASEEALAAAESERDRVRRLDATLSTTRDFLRRAQERVHRDIAPVLEGTLRAWLPRITAGRYTDASVDPETLEVKVTDASGQFREAGLLSQGTREQIYLLLRMALVTHLTKPGEICPLIFDDVTVQTDSPRTQAILELLHEISAGRQVILFSQEEDVRRWAERYLDRTRDNMIVLGEPVPSA